METFDYKFYYDTFTDMVKRASQWTHDMRGLNANANYVYDALYKLHKGDELPSSHRMAHQFSDRDRDNIVGCLRTVSWAAGQALDKQGTGGHRTLAIQAGYVMTALNLLFEKEGLEPVKKMIPDDEGTSSE